MMTMKEEREPALGVGEKTRWREVLYDFTQNTTIHALKQITEPTPFSIRRVIWVLILALGLVAFVVQVVESIIYYMSNPVAVNIMINYNDTLRFPAVTICNQNAFRMTEASNSGVYDSIENLFGHDHIDHTSNDTTERFQQVLDTPISQMYMDLAHRQEDFIVSCLWERQRCSADDFEKTLTDHGVCYTFNNAANLSQVKNASQTGALWGLRLRLNVEQYQYMMGPNSGAGVRVLVHSQRDYPLVGDFGQSVPPGLHAFLGVMIVEIHDLPEPHGKCQDNVPLEHFKRYTQAACVRECKQKMVRDYCGCSYGILPEHAPPGIPACTVGEYLKCVADVLDDFRKYRETCDCPYPCDRTHFDSDITYGEMSQFDMEKILRDNVSTLQEHYAAARETTQHVKKEIVQRDTLRALLLANCVRDINRILSEIPRDLGAMMDLFSEDAVLMKHKIWMHALVALKNVRYAILHDFIRGWEIVEERTFNHVATGFWEIVSSFDRSLELLGTTYADADIIQRQLFWYNIDDRLFNRLTMAQRALENLTEIYNAYGTGDPLLSFRITLERRYDHSFIPIQILKRHPGDRTAYYEECKKQLLKFISAIQEMRRCGESIAIGNATECVNIKINRDKFIKSAKMVNYNLFQFKTKVLEKPVEAADKLINEFQRMNQSLWEEYTFLQGLVKTVTKDIRHFVRASWMNIQTASDNYKNYTLYRATTKSSLAKRLNSQQMEDDLLHFEHFFMNLRSRATEIKDSGMRLREHYIDVFKTMAKEESTMAFYTKVQWDVLRYFTNPENASDYIRHFAYLTKLSKTRIRTESQHTLLQLLNADFYEMDISEAVMNITSFFSKALLKGAEIEGTVKNIDEFLDNLLNEIREDLKMFTQSTRIGYDFFRENYLNLDIYMRALSYEAITQQIAYDMTNLWSDIGGSIGLFIGASAISVFEILDIFLHTGMKVAREKHMKRRRSRANQNDFKSSNNKQSSAKYKGMGGIFTQSL